MLQAGSACPDCASCQTKATLQWDNPQVVVRLVDNPLITGTRYVARGTRCNVCSARFKTPIPSSIKNTPKYDASVTSTLAIYAASASW